MTNAEFLNAMPAHHYLALIVLFGVFFIVQTVRLARFESRRVASRRALALLLQDMALPEAAERVVHPYYREHLKRLHAAL